MTGIDKICDKILSDAQAECTVLIDRANAQAQEITQSYAQIAQTQAEQILSRGRKNADERKERLAGVAQLEARKLHLQTKQQMISSAFDAALKELCSMEQEEYIRVMAALAADGAVSGKEEVIMSSRDRESIGKQVVSEANKLIKARSEAADANAVKKLISMLSGGLTLSDETRDICGGLILREGNMEINATFETLIRLAEYDISGQVAEILFS